MVKKLLWAAVELVTIAIGTGVFVTNTLDSYVDEDSAGVGAFMVVSGLLLRSWKKELFKKNEVIGENSEPSKERNLDKTLIAGVFIIFAFTFWGLNHGKTKRNSSDISSIESNVNSLESNVNSLESKIDDLDSYSHYH